MGGDRCRGPAAGQEGRGQPAYRARAAPAAVAAALEVERGAQLWSLRRRVSQ